ncbi:fimbrial protein [Pseudomonas rhodesiae]|uniref:fimbrial protein n=1 Tax=Pseudomonas rhodesiae TaxID=76760 RepID=UPI0032B2BB10
MHDLTMGKFTWIRKFQCCFFILFSLVSQYALSADPKLSLTCSNTDVNLILRDVIPLSPFQTHFSGTCKVNSIIALGGFYTQIQSGKGNTTGRDLSVVAAASGYPVPYESAPSETNCFEPGNCEGYLSDGDTFSYDFIVSGTAKSTPGLYAPMVTVSGTDRAFSDNKVNIGSVLVVYTVVQPACSMSSASHLSLGFGALTSNDFASSQRVAEISLSCTAATQVNVTLVPTQSAVTGSPGVSATTLDGLSMAATWVDSSSAVVFNAPRSFAMSAGANLIQLGFRPQLNAGSSPVGDFSSQYTLNIVYP